MSIIYWSNLFDHNVFCSFLTPFFASASIVGIIVGMGLRPLIEDFFTGLFIFTQDIINVGDQVEIGGIEGNVERVGFRAITIADQTAAMHTFQNREVKKTVNYSKRKALVVIEIPIKLEKKKIDNILGLFQNVLDELKKDKQLGKYTHRNSALQGTQTIEKDGIITVGLTLITKINPKFNVKRKYNYPLLKELEKQKVALG